MQHIKRRQQILNLIWGKKSFKKNLRLSCFRVLYQFAWVGSPLVGTLWTFLAPDRFVFNPLRTHKVLKIRLLFLFGRFFFCLFILFFCRFLIAVNCCPKLTNRVKTGTKKNVLTRRWESYRLLAAKKEHKLWSFLWVKITHARIEHSVYIVP